MGVQKVLESYGSAALEKCTQHQELWYAGREQQVQVREGIIIAVWMMRAAEKGGRSCSTRKVELTIGKRNRSGDGKGMGKEWKVKKFEKREIE